MSLRSLFSPRSTVASLAAAVLFLASANLHAQRSPSRITAAISDRTVVTLKGNVHPQARSEFDRGTVEGTLPMSRMLLVLKRSDAQEKQLQETIRAMHDPMSPQYHNWLTPTEFGVQYGVSDQDLAKLTGWLKAHGFQVDKVANGRQTIEFSGTAAAVSDAFHTSIHSFVVKGQQHYANASDPAIPTALTPVVAGVVSLHNFVKASSSARILGKAEIVAATANEGAHLKFGPEFSYGSSSHAVGPGDLWTIYNATPLITASSNNTDGAGQSIAIVGRSDIALNDYTGFRKNLLPAPYSGTVPFTQILNGPDPGTVSGDDVESTLDVEYSSAMAPAAQIKFVVSGSTNTTDGIDLSAQYIVDNNLASVVSTSYGECEAGMGVTGNQFYSSLWEQAAAQGITSLVAAGDNGSAGCDLVGPSGYENVAYQADEGLQVSALASTPFNVAVGGNEFSDDTTTYWSTKNGSTPAPLTSALGHVPEKVWNESCSVLVCGDAYATIAAGSGGSSGCFIPTWDSTGNISACSGGYSTPDWQAGVVGIPSTGKRNLPDVSLTAASHDGYMVCYGSSCDSGGVYIIGGTSASSPSFAGIMALVNQKTGARQGQANYTLYRLAASEFGSEDSPNTANLSSCNASNGTGVGAGCVFYDVTSGTNAVPCDGGTLNCSSATTGTYGVLTGYDATAGYDRATGLGSVNVTNLVNHWNDQTLAATSTSLTLGAASSVYGQPVTVSVAVQPTSATGTPTGLVALITDSTIINAVGAGSLTLSNGAFSGTVSSLPGGTYNVTARYAGDTNFSGSTSPSTAITVNRTDSSIQLALSATDPLTGAQLSGTTVPYGSSITAAATAIGVTGLLPPGGTLTFLDNNNATLSTTSLDATGQASYVSGGYAIGSYTWKVSYAGNSNYKPSASPTATFTVAKANTTLKLLSSSSFLTGTNSATLTAIVEDDSFQAHPTGTVTFSVNGQAVSTVAVKSYTDPSLGNSAAIATYVLASSSLKSGANVISSSYTSGDGNYADSVSSSSSIGYSATVVTNAISLSATPASPQTGNPVTLTATVITGGIPATSGTVTFLDGKSVLGTAQVVGSNPATGYTTGTAVLKYILAPGSHTITATYGGILAAPVPVTSTASTVTVAGTGPSTISLSALSNTSNPLNYDLTAVVTGYGLATPSSTVELSETSVISNLGQITLDPSTAAHSFLSPSYYTAADPAGSDPGQSLAVDVNGDGILDIVTANASFRGGTMSVLIGNGDGTFKSAVTYPVGLFSNALTYGDFNGDGIVDIAVSSQYNSKFGMGYVSIFLGKGDGTFQPRITAQMPGYPVGVVAADFNRDGILDIATLQYYPMQISVAYGNGDGSFQSPLNYALKYSDGSAYALAVGDFNGDGAPDIAEVNANDNTVGVFLNTGDGTLVASGYLATGTEPQWVTVADVNQDGKQDMLISNYADNTIGVLLGIGDGTFQDQVTYPVNGYVSSMAVADMNGDGKLDIAAAYFYPTAAIGILAGNGDGTFAAPRDFKTNQGHGYAVAIGDLNGDGAPDLISGDINSGDSAAQNIAVLLNVTQATAVKTSVALAGLATEKQEIHATYYGDAHYIPSTSTGVFVNGSGTKSTPQIVWAPAAQWGGGIALGASVLNASVDGNIPGAFTYTAQLGTNSPVAVTATSTLTVGTYTITATYTPIDIASYGTATAQNTVQIVPPDFSVETSTQALSISAGGLGTVTVSVPSLYGFSGQVSLGCGASLPGGFSCTASPASIAPGASSTITIQTQGLTSSSIKATKPMKAAIWTAGGAVALMFLVVLPYSKRNRYAGTALIVLIAVAGILNGCGGSGTGYSQDAVALASSSSKAASGSTVTLTATVTSSHSQPGGTVIFYSGTAVLGAPVAVTNKTASLQIASLPIGLSSLSAVYSGDSHNSSATSGAVAQLITGQTAVLIQATNGTTTHSTTVQVTLQ